MYQVFFRIPFVTPWTPEGIPVYGYGFMLFLAFLAGTWLACRLGKHRNIPGEQIQDFALYLFLGGLIGARIVFMIQSGTPPIHFFFIWEGGLVFYGGLVGGALAFVPIYYLILRKHAIPALKMADIVAPCAALGICLGRIGCLLNGCCFGGVACPTCPQVHFPLSGMPRQVLVERGYQTTAGFTLGTGEGVGALVGKVEPGSPASQAGLHPGDWIVQANGQDISSATALAECLTRNWPRGKNDLQLTIRRDGQDHSLPAFYPKTIGLHPTQLYESISMGLLFVLLMAFIPFQNRDGQLLAIFLILYPIHRFLNEMLRKDTDPVAFGLTLSQNGSILFFAMGVLFLISLWLWVPPQKAVPPSQT